MTSITFSEERDEETCYGYCDDYQPHAVKRMFDYNDGMLYDMRWDDAGNLGQISLAGKEALFKSGRFLFWTEDNRLHTAVDENHYSYYVYDHSGERRVKLTGESELLDANADLMLTGSLLYKPTLYPSPYLVLSMNEYTKHYYAGAERVAACLGGGGLDIVTHGANHSSGTDPTGTSASIGWSYIGPGYEPNQPEASEEEELKKLASQLQDTANNLFNQSYHQLANRRLDQNDPDCLWEVDVYQEELRRPFVGIPDGVDAKVGIDLEKFRTSVIEQQEQHHDESEYVYYYHSDHLGSASWITDHDGNPVQHLQYLPYGEPYVDQRTSGYSERFRFTGKERDEETGYGYFGARYMDYTLMTMWLSVDPMADKYPSISPYAYCAWNPVKLVDPDGRKIRAVNPYSEKQIKRYLTAYVSVQSNNNSFLFSKTYVESGETYESYTTMNLGINSGATGSKPLGNTNCYPIAINDKGVAQGNSLTTDYYDENGSPVTTASTASCVFMHELLDEFLNTIINKEITPKSPNIEKVCYENAALRNIGLLERNGADHDY